MAEAIAIASLGRFLTPIISNLVLKGCTILDDDIKAKLQALQGVTLPKIKAIIEEAEKQGVESQPLAQWLKELKEAAYEAEDVLDDYEYRILERKAKGKSFKTVSGLLSSASNAFTKPFFKNKVRNRLEKLNQIASSVNVFVQLLGLDRNNSTAQHSVINTHVTTSELPEPQVFGRDSDRDAIIQLLTKLAVQESEREFSSREVGILPVIGVGGVGKTTLAQYVYNDPKIIEHFNLRMWIHMSQNFDEVRLTRSMIESASGDACPNIENFDVLQKKLIELIERKRFLLVLDDVWYDEKQSEFANKERWRKLCAPLRHAGAGSMILITSRMELVAKTCNAMQPIILKGLTGEQCLSLFNKYAFDGAEKPNEHLTAIGEQIVKKIVSKLGGLPIAAKVVGGMLRNKLDAEEWTNILKRDIWDDIMGVLTLSYHRLPPHLQQCIAHHSLYPKGMPFRRDYLVHVWITEGFVHAEHVHGTRMEDVASVCLDELVFRSFFQCMDDDLFVLHDLMHDVADSVSIGECIRIAGEEKREIPPSVKHLCIDIEKLDDYKENICKLKNLRTLFCTRNLESKFVIDHDVLDGIFNKSKRLRALDLSACSVERLPKSIGYLKHLRFVDLSGSSVQALPKSFSRLYHLLHLDLSKCRLHGVPKGLNKLINLRHLIADRGMLSMIPKIGSLSSLQKLAEFHVKRKKKGFDVGQLKNLRELGGKLRVLNLENVKNKSEAADAKLKEKIHLDELWLGWGGSSEEDGSPGNAVMVLDELQPPPQITRLGIKGYAGNRPPTWMQSDRSCLPNLQTLVLDKWAKWECQTPLGQLFPHLRELVLSRCGEVSHLPYLPANLTKLVVFDCPSVVFLTEEELQMRDVQQAEKNLSRTPVIAQAKIRESLLENPKVTAFLQDLMNHVEANDIFVPSFTVLDHLETWVRSVKLEAILKKLSRTPEESVQQLPCSLQHLELHYCFIDDTALSECLKSLLLLSRLTLSQCVCITSLPSDRVFCRLKRLEMIDIDGCLMLTSLGGIGGLVSLRDLSLMTCPNLMAVMEDGGGSALLPQSLVKLRIIDCEFLDMYLNRCLEGLINLAFLAISHCVHLKSLPSAEEFSCLASLKSLGIKSCRELASVGGLHAIGSLDSLYVGDCPSLLTSASASSSSSVVPAAAEGLSSVSLVSVDDFALLPILLSREGLASVQVLGLTSPQDTPFTRRQEEGLQRLLALDTLFITECPRLPSLPANLSSLTSLKNLKVESCAEIRSLPRLPASLEIIMIQGCHAELVQRCQENGAEWDNIKHIPIRYIL